jgi:hypothetical protein
MPTRETETAERTLSLDELGAIEEIRELLTPMMTGDACGPG